MTELSKDILKALASHEGPCVSIYIPTHASGPDTRQEPIRLKNLLAKAEERLLAAGATADEVRRILAPARALPGDGFFERSRGKGVALFLATDLFRHFELPLALEESVYVGRAFHLKPLLGVPVGEERCFVLALSRNEVRLIRGSRRSAHEIPLPMTARSLTAFLGLGENPQRGLQGHTGPHARGDRGIMYHSAAPQEDEKQDLLRFFREVDRSVRKVLGDERAPLMLACVDYLAPIYREANGYEAIADTHLSGNPDGAPPEELRDRALAGLRPVFASRVDEAAGRYRRHAGSERASPHLGDAVAAALEGRIDVLFVTRGAERYGPPPREGGAVELHERPEPGDVDLVDFAAVQTLLHGGTVYALDRKAMPVAAEAAALFRY